MYALQQPDRWVMKHKFIALFATLMLFLGAANGVQADDPVNTGIFSNTAVSGYDAVAYFTEGKPVKGNKTYRMTYMGAEWRFSPAENLAMFRAAPENYAPQYGGYCSWAAGRGYLADGNPKNWRIVDGKLYLNYNDDVQQKWEQDIPGFIAKANKNYPQLVDLEEGN